MYFMGGEFLFVGGTGGGVDSAVRFWVGALSVVHCAEDGICRGVVGGSCGGSIANSVVEGGGLDLLIPWSRYRGACAGGSVGVSVALNVGSASGYVGLGLLFWRQLRRGLWGS